MPILNNIYWQLNPYKQNLMKLYPDYKTLLTMECIHGTYLSIQATHYQYKHNHQQLTDDRYVCLHWLNMQLIKCIPYFELTGQLWVNICTFRSRVVYSSPLMNNTVSFISRIMYTVYSWQLILPLSFRVTLLMLGDHKIALAWSLLINNTGWSNVHSIDWFLMILHIKKWY